MQDNYSKTNIGSWISNQHTVTVATDGNPNNITTTFNVSDSQDNIIFTITQIVGTTFLGDFIVSYIPSDTYRSERLLGTDINDATQISSFNETFVSTTYSVIKSGATTVTNIVGFSNIPGFYLRNNYNASFTSSNIQLGDYISNRVLSEYVSVALVGNTGDPSSADELTDINSLTYSDNSGNNHSATITLLKYRGYESSYTGTVPSFTDNIQVYTINRDSTIVTFNVNNMISQTLTSNMYVGEYFLVNDLVDINNVSCANLNIYCTAQYSIPPTGSRMSYIVSLVADPVTVTITNPNYTGTATNISVPSGSTPVYDPKDYTDSMTLFDYGRDDAYTFSGNFRGTGPVSIRPSRIKLRNTAFSSSTLTYYIQYKYKMCTVYKANSTMDGTNSVGYNWLGNPTLLLDTNIVSDAYLAAITANTTNPSDANAALLAIATTNNTNVLAIWAKQAQYTSTEIKIGFNIGNYFINQRADVTAIANTCYFVSCPSYYKFNCVSSANAVVIPYDYSSISSNNLITRSLAYTGLTQTFNPFAGSVSIQDINGNNLIYTNDSSIINDITFKFVNNYSPTLINMLQYPDINKHRIIVPGIIVNIDLYKGDSSGNSSATLTQNIFNGSITSIPTTANISNTSIVFRNRDASGGIHFSLLQFPEDVGFSSGLDSYEYLYQTKIQSNYYTINLCMENPSWYNNNYSSVYFDANAVGTKPTLYTSVIMYNPSIKRNFVRIYKYLSGVPFDFNILYPTTDADGFQLLELKFDVGRTYFDCSLASFTVTSNSSYNLENLIANAPVENLNVTWTTDTDYSTTLTTIGWKFDNSTVATNMPIELFNVQFNETKCIFIKLLETMVTRNQFNIPTSYILWDATHILPSMNTTSITLSETI